MWLRYVFLVFLLNPLAIRAQTEQSLILPDLLEMIQGNAPSLAADSMDIAVAYEQLQRVRNNRMPSLQVNVQASLGTNNNMPGGFFSNGLVPGNSRVRDEANSRTILTDLGVASFDWEVYNFGGYRADTEVAMSELDV